MSDLGPVNPGYAADVEWLRRWRLRPEGDPKTTASSLLIRARTEDGDPVVLKVAHSEEEARGSELLAALDGHGVARVLRREGEATLVERATGRRNLVRMVQAGHDDAATRIICEVAKPIHAATPDVLASASPPELIDLPTWFRHLFAYADEFGAFHRRGADIAHELLDDPRDETVLHGDLHHGNVLDFGERGWLAIDPKGLLGEAAFDACNVLTNPSHERALAPGRLERQFAVVLATTGIPPERMARWFVAWCALSSTWFALDDDPGLAASATTLGERALGLVSS